MSDATTPRVITKQDPRFVDVEWADGRRTRYRAWELRALCPCARCVDELTGRRILDTEGVPRDLVHEDVRLVGTYAISIRFEDGHDTGIYPFAMLRKNDPAAASGADATDADPEG